MYNDALCGSLSTSVFILFPLTGKSILWNFPHIIFMIFSLEELSFLFWWLLSPRWRKHIKCLFKLFQLVELKSYPNMTYMWQFFDMCLKLVTPSSNVKAVQSEATQSQLSQAIANFFSVKPGVWSLLNIATLATHSVDNKPMLLQYFLDLQMWSGNRSRSEGGNHARWTK